MVIETKLSDNNLTNELVENMSFLYKSQSRKLSFLWLLQVISVPDERLGEEVCAWIK